MQSLFVTCYQRIILWNAVGAHNASNLKEAAPLLRLIEKLRLTDQEMIDSNFFSDGQQFTWKLPSRGYGDRTVELENTEATALAKVIEALSPIRVSDAEWMTRIVEKFQPQENPVEVLPREENGR